MRAPDPGSWRRPPRARPAVPGSGPCPRRLLRRVRPGPPSCASSRRFGAAARPRHRHRRRRRGPPWRAGLRVARGFGAGLAACVGRRRRVGSRPGPGRGRRLAARPSAWSRVWPSRWPSRQPACASREPSARPSGSRPSRPRSPSRSTTGSRCRGRRLAGSAGCRLLRDLGPEHGLELRAGRRSTARSSHGAAGRRCGPVAGPSPRPRVLARRRRLPASGRSRRDSG